MKSIAIFFFIFTFCACTPSEKTEKVKKKNLNTFLSKLTVIDTTMSRMNSGEEELIIRYQSGVTVQYGHLDEEEVTSVFLANTDFKTGFQHTKDWFGNDIKLGRFLHTVFRDSIPTTTWEQLIHDGDNEATIVVNADSLGQIRSLFMDVNTTKDPVFLNMESDGKNFSLSWSIEASKR